MVGTGRFLFGALAAAAVTGLSVTSAAAADASNQFVYSFTYSSNQNVSARDASDNAETVDSMSGALNGGSNGMSHYRGNLTDRGTMTVQVVRQQPDGGLIVSISEQGEQTRRAPAATCVVYGNTQVICDPNKTVYTEEYTLLRFLGKNFVDPSELDANRHWSIGGTTDLKADYTIGSNANGMMQISEARHMRASTAGQTTDVQTKIGYDFTRAIPTSIDEYVTQRRDSGVSGTSTTIYQTTLSLVSSSSTAATGP